MSDAPPPGHPNAIALGCLCPETDNRHGEGSGMVDLDGLKLWWVNYDCPVHVEQ